LHLEKDIAGAQPQVLLVAPMSGHFATLLRGTAQTLLADHDVYISDWRNARDIGLRHGEFGFDEFIDHVTTFLQVLGPGVHVVGVCQPCVAVLAAVAIMAADCDPTQPLHQTRSRATPEPGVKGKTRPHAGCSKQPVPRVCRAEAIARAIAAEHLRNSATASPGCPLEKTRTPASGGLRWPAG
jgi:hypothetical protein